MHEHISIIQQMSGNVFMSVHSMCLELGGHVYKTMFPTEDKE